MKISMSAKTKGKSHKIGLGGTLLKSKDTQIEGTLISLRASEGNTCFRSDLPLWNFHLAILTVLKCCIRP